MKAGEVDGQRNQLPGVHYKHIALLDYCITSRNHGIAVFPPDLNELYILFILIIAESFHDILAVIYHIQLFCDKRKKKTLKCHRDNGDAEDDIVYIVSAVSRTDYGDNGKYSGCGASETGECGQRLLAPRGAERRHQQEYRHRSCDKSKSQEYEKSSSKDRQQRGREDKKSQQEKDKHLSQTVNTVKKLDQRDLRLVAGIPHDKSEKIYAQITIAPCKDGRRHKKT